MDKDRTTFHTKVEARRVARVHNSAYPWYSYNVVKFTDGYYRILIVDKENIISWLKVEARC